MGSYVVEKLRQRGAEEIYIPLIEDFDLIKVSDIRRMLEHTRPDIIIHLAAHVGGIGANRDHPAEFFYDNLMMGVQLMHEAWKQGVEKFVALGTVCAYPKYTLTPFKKKICGMGIPKIRMHPMGWPKRCCLCRLRLTDNNTDLMRSILCL